MKELLIKYFKSIPEMADKRGRKYNQCDVLSLITVGLSWEATDFTNIEKELNNHAEEIYAVLGIERIPSHDTLNRLLSSIDSKYIMKLLI